MHGLAAQLQKPRRVVDPERAGGRQGGIFPEAVAGDEGRAGDLDAELALQRPHDRQTDRHQSRLGVLGEGEVLDRAVEHQLRELLGERLVHLLEHLARRGEGLGQLGPHADRLAALSRKGEGEAHVALRPDESGAEG